MLKQLWRDFRLSPSKKRALIIGLLPIYPFYFLYRKRRARLKRAANTFYSGRLICLSDLSGTLDDVAPISADAETEKKIENKPDTFALCRIIGNDLEPRHKTGQSIANLRFILDYEAEFEGLKKLWLVNRIFNPETEAKIIALLEERAQIYRRIPFNSQELQSIGFDFGNFEDKRPFYDGSCEVNSEEKNKMNAVLQAYKSRNNYVMNNNGARNAALSFCLEHGKWAMPFDGNCFFTATAWASVRSNILAAPDKRYFTVPMARITNNDDLLLRDRSFAAEEEPQIVFRSDAPLRFNEDHQYGRRPKVEMLLHLGVDGPWQRWPSEQFDTPPRKVHPEGHRVGRAGWVARLNSGKQQLETPTKSAHLSRGVARSIAIRETLEMLETRQVSDVLATHSTLIYHNEKIHDAAQEDINALNNSAREATTRGPFSVAHKPSPGPSGDIHDYFHPAPYWWPNPRTKNGLPYVRKDGERRPGTDLYEKESEKFDRTRLQRLFDDTTVLALASVLPHANPNYRAHACNNLRTWFMDPATAMTPALTYAQVRMGHQENKGAANGLIETKDFYFLLDAVRLLDDPEITSGIEAWCEKFLVWFTESEQGVSECRNHNNHGTCYDLQASAHAAFLGRADILHAINFRAQARAQQTITPKGEQPYELKRTLTHHYCVFNLQSWVNLFDLLTAAGLRPWNSEAGERVRAGLRWTLTLSNRGWTGVQTKPFDHNRLLPLNEAFKNQTGEDLLRRAGKEGPTHFNPHDGVAPFWRLTRLGLKSQ